MTQATPNLNLTLWDSSGDQALTFAGFRSTMAGTGGSSNLSKIDNAVGTINSQIAALQLTKGAIPVAAAYDSPSTYVATVGAITSYYTGLTIILSVDTTTDGTTALNINSLGLKSLMKVNSAGTAINLTGSDLVKGRNYLFAYDGVRWLWVSANSADQIQIVGDVGNVVTVGSSNNLDGTTTPAALVGNAIHAGASKATPLDSDEFSLLDSAVSFILKKLSWGNLKAALKSYLESVNDGWIPDTNTWTYSNADGATGVVSINGNMTTRLQKGMRVKYTQSVAPAVYWSYDSSSNSDLGVHNGTDTAVTYTAGKFGNAATFNGTTSKIVYNDASIWKPTADFTIGCWFKTSVTGTEKGIFQSYSATPTNAGIGFRIQSSNVLYCFIGKGTGSVAGIDYTELTGTTNVCDGNWHYAVITYKNNYMQMYLDGELEAAGFSHAPAYNATNYVRIGCKALTGTDSSFFNGQIDDLFLALYALDGNTIRKKYVQNTAQGTGNITVEKMGIITDVGRFNGSNMLLTFWGGTDFSLGSGAISLPHFSYQKFPQGFPASPNKWAVEMITQDSPVKSAPSGNIWYGNTDFSPTAPSIVVPAGLWRLGYKCMVDFTSTLAAASNVGVRFTLTDQNGVESDKDLTTSFTVALPAMTSAVQRGTYATAKVLELASKTTFYTNVLAGAVPGTTPSFTLNGGNVIKNILRAECAYL